MDAEQKKEEQRRISEEKKFAQSKIKGRLESTDNPCLNEHQLSNKCMMENQFIEDACTTYFENYKACKSFWWSVQRDRKRRNIVPEMPPANEREKIKADYMKKMSQN